MAVSTPRGRPTTVAPMPIIRVPLISGSTPYRPPSPLPWPGAQTVPVRNSTRLDSRKNSTASTTSTATMPTVTAMDSTAQANRAPTMTRSPVRGLRLAMLTSARGQEGLQLGQALGVVVLGRGHVADVGDQLRRLLQVELHVLADLGPLERVLLDVDEQRPRQRVAAGGDGLGGRLDALGPLLGDPDVLQAFLVVLPVGVAEEAPGVGLSLDALDQGVVVRGGGVVAAGLEAPLLGVAEDLIVEEVIGPRLGVRGEDGDLLVGEFGIDLVPGGGPALLEDLGHLLEVQGVQEAVLGRGDDGQAVQADPELLVLDALGRTGLLLVVVDGPRGVGDVGLAVAELGEAAAGAGSADGDLDPRLLLVELLGDGLADRGHGRGAVDRDRAREAGPPGAAAGVVVAATGGGDQGDGQGQAEQPAPAPRPLRHWFVASCADVSRWRRYGRSLTRQTTTGERQMNGKGSF